MNFKFSIYVLAFISILFFACNGGSDETSDDNGNADDQTTDVTDANDDVEPGEPIILEQEGIKLTEVMNLPFFKGASLKITNPTSAEPQQVGMVDFNFEVKNYILGDNTRDADSRTYMNSIDGQHIHFILDNGPYKALYSPEYKSKMGEGVHTILTFLSRSYHISVKQEGAFDLMLVQVGDNVKYDSIEFVNPDGNKEIDVWARVGDSSTLLPDMSSPHLFFSRPKGEYYAGDKGVVILDFYLVNCDLSPDGYKVKVDISWASFILDKWAAYEMTGLPVGVNPIKLELLDKDGNVVPGPFNSVERRFINSPPDEM